MPSRLPAEFSRVLFIAPSDSGLDVVPEIDSISEFGYSVRALQGEVTAERIFAVCRTAKFGILHFACHSVLDGIVLSDGKLFDIDSILQVARITDARLVFLNACSTSIIGQTLVDESVPVAICTMKEVPDHIAKQTAQVFYQHLSQFGDAHEAYKASKPSTRGMYQWLSDGGYQEMVMEPLMKRLNAIQIAIELNSKEHEENRREHDTMTAVNDEEHKAIIARLSGEVRISRTMRVMIGLITCTVVAQFILMFLWHAP